MFKDPELETDARARISTSEPERLLTRFATLTRESGTPDEHAAGEYIAERLRALGVPVTVHVPDLFLSIPERSELRLIDAARGTDAGNRGQGGASIRSRPPAFALSTNGEELIGELC